MSNPANTATAYWVPRRTARMNEVAERWADSQAETYWEITHSGVSVHWVKVDGLTGWFLLNDAAFYVVSHTQDEVAAAQDDYELLGWRYEEVGQVDGAAHEPYDPPLERVGLLPLLAAIRQLRGPGYYEDAGS